MKKYCHRAQFIARAALEDRVAVLRRHVDAAASHDVDGIHDLRVASRRLRAVLDDMRAQYRKKALKPFIRRIKSITRGLGTARELDVSIGLLGTLCESSKSNLQQTVEKSQRRLRKLRLEENQVVDRSCTLANEDAFTFEYEDLGAALKQTEPCYLKQAASTLDDRLEELRAAYKAWHNSEDEELLHKVRLAFKKFRYSCEICKEIYGEPMETFLVRVKEAQESLGQWNDFRVTRDYINRVDDSMNRSNSDVEALVTHVNDRTAATMAKFSESADHFFSKTAIAQTRRLLEEPCVACCAHGTSKRWKKKGNA